ncbi:hypothetical protein, partial [Vibrio parahaemolyticus]
LFLGYNLNVHYDPLVLMVSSQLFYSPKINKSTLAWTYFLVSKFRLPVVLVLPFWYQIFLGHQLQVAINGIIRYLLRCTR